MLVKGSHFFFDSDQTQFREELVAQASEYEGLLVGGVTAGPVKSFITSVRLLSLQNLPYRIEFHSMRYNNVNSASTYANPSHLIGIINALPTTDALPQNWSGADVMTATQYGTMYAYFRSGLNIPYEDRGGEGRLHVNLVNLGTVTKNPGDSGIVHLRVGVVAAT